MKKFLILILMLAPMSMLAQKFGYVNSAEIIQVMPEYSKALKDVQALEIHPRILRRSALL